MPVDTERVLAALLGVAFEVGAGGVEEQQVDLEVKQVGDGEEHRLLHLGLGVGLHQQVHRAVSLVLIHRLQAVDGHVVAGPLRRRQLRPRVDGPVGGQREQHPLHVGGEPPRTQHLAQRGVHAQRLPEPIQQMHRAHRPRAGHREPLTGQLRGIRWRQPGIRFAQVTVDRGDQAAQPVPVQLVLPAQVQQHLRLGHPVHPPVVRQLHIPDHRAVPVPPLRGPQVHAHKSTKNHERNQARHGKSCAHAFSGFPDHRNTMTRADTNQDALACPLTAELG